MPKRLTTEEFIKKAKEIHGDKYDYSLTEYISNKKKVKIICPVHGVFEQLPLHHLQGSGCRKCGGTAPLTTEEFIERARSIHGDKYDYSLVEYKGIHKKVKIICPIHGVFEQTPEVHLKTNGCHKCYIIESKTELRIDPKTGEKTYTKPKKDNTESMKERGKKFIERARSIHGDRFDYSLVEYKGTHEKVKIKCNKHNIIFEQAPHDHLKYNGGCPKCAIEGHIEKTKKTNEEYIRQAREVHGDKYDYSKINYVNNYTDIEIICPEHGSFFQNPKGHLRGLGCPQCGGSISEKKIALLLKRNNIIFTSQKKFDWLKYRRDLVLDFYLPDYNIAIECQGRQHFEIVDWFGGKTGYNMIVKRDELKKKLCEEHGIKILYYANYKYDFPYNVYTDAEKLIDDIRNNIF